MKVLVLGDEKKAVFCAAEMVVASIKKKPNLVLGLATGKTMVGFYKALVSLLKREKLNLDRVKTFNLDEYFELSKGNRESFRFFMDKYFFKKVGILEKNINFLNGRAKNVAQECKKYESAIKKADGIDLQILGIGVNGHIGFNEPGSSFNSRTRKVELTYNTRKVNSKFFGNRVGGVPKSALTMGIKTVLDARKVVLLALGRQKVDAISSSFAGKVDEELPASVLQKHKSFVIVLDRKAAGGLKAHA